MINLQPINIKIRKTLAKKSKTVARDFDPLESTDVQIQKEYARAIWTKMFSPVDSTAKKVGKKLVPNQKPGLNTVTLMGGALGEDDKMIHGFNDLYSQGEHGSGKTDGPLDPKSTEGAKSYRPIPGIKDISVAYKGGLSAIREATINWTCWSFEDLEKLTPHFMAHGKGVLLEWGWSTPVKKKGDTPETSLITTEEMIDGRAYSQLQDNIIRNAGNYDAMAGIISNWEWTLRDDGGFDCTTTIVSRGVNILQGDTSGAGTKITRKVKDEDGNETIELEPNLKEFVGGLRESLFNLCKAEDHWWDAGGPLPLSPWDATNWTKGEKQPPGVLVNLHDNWFTNVAGGPWVTWGFFEDNILSRFVGQINKDGKPITSFRSIEPVLSNDNPDGQYLDNDGEPTDNPYEAKFQSVIIRNSQWLITPSFNRWVLPGQFPATDIHQTFWDFTNDYKVFVQKTAVMMNNPDHFRPFAVSPAGTDRKGYNNGGYLRNILISYDLIQEAFIEANTIPEGMNALFDEFNKDLDGYWKFELVSDVQNEGNVKVVDMNKTAMTPAEYIEDREGKENPDSKLFVFPSWGEKSIVKSQTLNSKVPSAMAVSAMYAGSADEDKKDEGAPPEAQAIAGLQGSDATDLSQIGHQFVERLSSNQAYGSISPYGDLEEGKFYSSDMGKKTAIPSGEKFGRNKGITFKLDRLALIKYYNDEIEKHKGDEEKKKEAGKKAAKAQEQAARSEGQTQIAIDNFKTGLNSNGTTFECQKDAWWGTDNEKFTLYNEEGDLWEHLPFNVVFRRTMIELIHGRSGTKKEKESAMADPIIPLELEITIDGTGGIIPGNCFHVDYIPEIYKSFCIFQALSVDHSVSAENWTSTIKGQIRVAMNKLLAK